ncbi:MAG: hypothetical protein ACE5H8_09500 [Alphaproteobacteria bacterium]
MKSVLMLLVRSAAVVLVAGLAACQSPPTPAFPEITFRHLQPIRLDVADIEYVETYKSPRAAPNVEHLFPVQLAPTVRRWVTERFDAVGITRRARVTLVNAAVTETSLKTKKGLSGLFYNDQAVRYDGTVEVRVEILDDRGLVTGHVRAAAKRSQTVAEDITLNERDEVWFTFTEELMKALDAELDKTIRTYLAPYVR